MGNQESISNDKYIIRKKQDCNIVNLTNEKQSVEKQRGKKQTENQPLLLNNKQKQSESIRHNISTNQKSNISLKGNTNKQNVIINDMRPDSRHDTRHDTRHDSRHDDRPDTRHDMRSNTDTTDNYEKIVNKDFSNSAIMERGMMTSMYKMQNKPSLFDYPTNSNDLVDKPKPNFDNVSFTPFNFNDEVTNFKKGMKEEKVKFEETEKDRRKRFEKVEEEKQEYLQSQIKNFELKYNPWEILGLKYKDYNIDNIKKAYKKCALKHHPDRGGDKDDFQLITQSYIYLLNTAEEKGYVEKKINKQVIDMDYEDDINEKAENIYVNKDNFDVNQFNKIFDKYKVPTVYDKGYNNLMKEDMKKNNDEIFGQKFNKDVFNAHFDNVKTKKSNELTVYHEPDALDSSLNNLNQSFLGMDDVEDFGSVNTGNLSYTDYKKAHIDETLLIDVNKVKYKTYKSIDQLESDRSSLSYTPSVEDRQRYEYMERKKSEDDNIRLQKQKDYDDMVGNQYNKINRKLIVHR